MKDEKIAMAAVMAVLFLELAGVGFASYVFTAALAVEYLITGHQAMAVAVVILVLYWTLLLLMVSPLVRQLTMLAAGPPYVPLSGLSYVDPEKAFPLDDEVYGKVAPFTAGDRLAYLCNSDGMPRWCNICATWKPDRAHHCSDVNRCVDRMDHFCPWFGGVIGDRNMKFFVQFTFYTAVWCLFGIVTLAYFVNEQRVMGATHTHNFITMCIALALMAVFFVFTAGMTYVFTWRVWHNVTEIELLQAQARGAVALNINHYSKQARAAGSQESTGPVTYNMRYFWGDKSKYVRPKGGFVPAMEDGRLGSGTAYAIIHLGVDDNVFDLGSGLANWKSVMGDHVWDWFLPIRRSPEAVKSFGPLLDELADRYNITRQ